MRYLVTGGAGFIGSHLVETLVNQGEQVRVLDNFETGKRENIQPWLSKIELIEGDIRNLETCRKACTGVDYVLHQGALGSVPRSIEDPLTTNEVNITGTLNMLTAAREAKVKRFVFASSSAIYGDSPVLPKIETMLPKPLSPYGLSKYTAETYLDLFFSLYGLETVALRYFNVFGPRQDPHSQYSAVIPLFVAALAAGKSPTIFGDGTQTRDFTYVSDVVAANLLSCTAPRESCGTFYNVACHQRIVLNDLFISLRDIVARTKGSVLKIEPVYAPPRVGDIKDSFADISKAEKALGYRPQASFITGLEKTVQWFLKQ